MLQVFLRFVVKCLLGKSKLVEVRLVLPNTPCYCYVRPVVA